MVAALLLAQPDPGRQLFLETFRGYAKHETVQLAITHHNSSGLFPGDYKQTLKWRKGGRFELVVTQPAGELPAFGMHAPNYFSDGKLIRVVRTDRKTTFQELDHGPNTGPGWEVSTAHLLAFMVGTSSVKVFENGRPGTEISYLPPTAARWRGQRCREVRVELTLDGKKQEFRSYFAADAQLALGFEYNQPGLKGWVMFSDQKFDLPLPATLGD